MVSTSVSSKGYNKMHYFSPTKTHRFVADPTISADPGEFLIQMSGAPSWWLSTAAPPPPILHMAWISDCRLESQLHCY